MPRIKLRQNASLGSILIVLAAPAFWGCSEEGLGDATGSTCPSDSTLTYANFGQAFMQTNCLACHTAKGPESPKLDTLDQIKAELSDIDRAAASGPNGTNTFMPEDGSVSTAERQKLGEWLACGAPE